MAAFRHPLFSDKIVGEFQCRLMQVGCSSSVFASLLVAVMLYFFMYFRVVTFFFVSFVAFVRLLYGDSSVGFVIVGSELICLLLSHCVSRTLFVVFRS